MTEYRCIHCGMARGDHKAETFNCPTSRSRFAHFDPSKTFEPNHNKPLKKPAFRI